MAGSCAGWAACGHPVRPGQRPWRGRGRAWTRRTEAGQGVVGGWQRRWLWNAVGVGCLAASREISTGASLRWTTESTRSTGVADAVMRMTSSGMRILCPLSGRAPPRGGAGGGWCATPVSRAQTPRPGPRFLSTAAHAPHTPRLSCGFLEAATRRPGRCPIPRAPRQAYIPLPCSEDPWVPCLACTGPAMKCCW